MSDDDLYFGPCLHVSTDEQAWTSEQLEQFAAEWRRKMRDGTFGRPVLLTPLPRRVRLRLAAEHAVNGIGIWLVNRGRISAAKRLWRL